MIFRENFDSFHTLFKIKDAFPKVLDFSTIDFRRYLKKVWRYPKILYTFFSKITQDSTKNYTLWSDFQTNIRKYLTVSPNFRRLLRKNWNLFIISLDGHCMFFRQFSDIFYTLLKKSANFPNFLDFVTIKLR